jgi:coiled-coil domain-containing protein 130
MWWMDRDSHRLAYVVVEGGRKRDTGEDDETDENRIRLGHEGDRDAFAKLEGKVQDKKQVDWPFLAMIMRREQLRRIEDRNPLSGSRHC